METLRSDDEKITICQGRKVPSCRGISWPGYVRKMHYECKSCLGKLEAAALPRRIELSLNKISRRSDFSLFFPLVFSEKRPYRFPMHFAHRARRPVCVCVSTRQITR